LSDSENLRDIGLMGDNEPLRHFEPLGDKAVLRDSELVEYDEPFRR
jgi:hypothetical protein